MIPRLLVVLLFSFYSTGYANEDTVHTKEEIGLANDVRNLKEELKALKRERNMVTSVPVTSSDKYLKMIMKKIHLFEEEAEKDKQLTTTPIGEVLGCVKKIAYTHIDEGSQTDTGSVFLDDVFKNCIFKNKENEKEDDKKGKKRTIVEIVLLIGVILIISYIRTRSWREEPLEHRAFD